MYACCEYQIFVSARQARIIQNYFQFNAFHKASRWFLSLFIVHKLNVGRSTSLREYRFSTISPFYRINFCPEAHKNIELIQMLKQRKHLVFQNSFFQSQFADLSQIFHYFVTRTNFHSSLNFIPRLFKISPPQKAYRHLIKKRLFRRMWLVENVVNNATLNE